MNDKKVVRRTLRLEARVTEQEYIQAAKLAKTCGLSMSDYVRRTALGQHPRQRLSDREVEYLTGSNVRTDDAHTEKVCREYQQGQTAWQECDKN